jgi:methylenetetrahydrofolate dehydrogenase (NADP+)/methenyltetrahydrofolate cyclohydrolase
MSAFIIDGRARAATLRAALKERIKGLGTPPGLAVIMVGDHPASAAYVAGKVKACAEVGMASHVYHLAAATTAAELHTLIDTLNDNDRVHGILLQLPLPAHLEALPFLARIDPRKDVDGLHPTNLGLLMAGRPSMVPCTPRGVMALLHEVMPDLRGKIAVVVGRSVLVGKPMTQLLTLAHATVIHAHSHTPDLAALTRQADLVVVAAGVPGLIGPTHIKPGAVVIDVGISRVGERLMGDVDVAGVAPLARAITPVPGGVGPMTIVSLLENTLQAAGQ